MEKPGEISKLTGKNLRLSRRDVLRTGLAVGAGFFMSRFGQARDMAPLLVTVAGSHPERMVRRVFDLLGGAHRFVSPGDRVVIKPNASFANPDSWGNNTNPEVVAATCQVVREAGARKVVVVDYPLMRGADALRLNGIAEACKPLQGVALSVLGKQHQFRTIKLPRAKALHEVAVAREVLDADVLINLPVAKAHDAVAASIGLKNLMGVIWDRTAFHTMMDINQAISDLALAVRPTLTLVDMTRIMATNGPKGPGEIATPNLLVASTDPVAADSFCLSQVRFNHRKLRPRQLRYLAYAHAAGLGEIDLKKISIRKERV